MNEEEVLMGRIAEQVRLPTVRVRITPQMGRSISGNWGMWTTSVGMPCNQWFLLRSGAQLRLENAFHGDRWYLRGKPWQIIKTIEACIEYVPSLFAPLRPWAKAGHQSFLLFKDRLVRADAISDDRADLLYAQKASTPSKALQETFRGVDETSRFRKMIATADM